MSGKVVSGVDGGDHAVDGEEGGQVGRVGRDQDQGEKPPDTACNNDGGGNLGCVSLKENVEDDLICRHLICLYIDWILG